MQGAKPGGPRLPAAGSAENLRPGTPGRGSPQPARGRLVADDGGQLGVLRRVSCNPGNGLIRALPVDGSTGFSHQRLCPLGHHGRFSHRCEGVDDLLRGALLHEQAVPQLQVIDPGLCGQGTNARQLADRLSADVGENVDLAQARLDQRQRGVDHVSITRRQGVTVEHVEGRIISELEAHVLGSGEGRLGRGQTRAKVAQNHVVISSTTLPGSVTS